MIGLPLRRGFRVTLSLRSGRSASFVCDDFVLRQKPAEFVLGLEAARAPQFPDFVCLADVVAITSTKVIRLRRPELWDAIAWAGFAVLVVGLRAGGLLP